MTQSTKDFPKGLGSPAKRTLNEAGYYGIAHLTTATESQIMALGVKDKEMQLLREALNNHGLKFAE